MTISWSCTYRKVAPGQAVSESAKASGERRSPRRLNTALQWRNNTVLQVGEKAGLGQWVVGEGFENSAFDMMEKVKNEEVPSSSRANRGSLDTLDVRASRNASVSVQ